MIRDMLEKSSTTRMGMSELISIAHCVPRDHGRPRRSLYSLCRRAACHALMNGLLRARPRCLGLCLPDAKRLHCGSKAHPTHTTAGGGRGTSSRRRRGLRIEVGIGGAGVDGILSRPEISEPGRTVAPDRQVASDIGVDAENLDTNVLVMQPADQGMRYDASGLLNRP
jgi:hypothetical protein